MTIYCGSSAGRDGSFVRDARKVGELLAQAGVEVITGAGATGMMRAVADGALEAGGTVHGIIPRFMVERGWDYKALTRTTVTETMHARKELMARLSIGAIALPGGVGTWEELMEVITWRQLGIYSGNIVVLNTAHYYDSLCVMMERAECEGFIHSDHLHLFTMADTPEEAVEAVLSSATNSFSPKL